MLKLLGSVLLDNCSDDLQGMDTRLSKYKDFGCLNDIREKQPLTTRGTKRGTSQDVQIEPSSYIGFILLVYHGSKLQAVKLDGRSLKRSLPERCGPSVFGFVF